MTSWPKVVKMLNCAPPLLEHLCYSDVVGGERAGWARLFLAILGALSARVKGLPRGYGPGVVVGHPGALQHRFGRS